PVVRRGVVGGRGDGDDGRDGTVLQDRDAGAERRAGERGPGHGMAPVWVGVVGRVHRGRLAPGYRSYRAGRPRRTKSFFSAAAPPQPTNTPPRKPGSNARKLVP